MIELTCLIDFEALFAVVESLMASAPWRALIRMRGILIPLAVIGLALWRRRYARQERAALWLSAFWNLQALFVLNLVAIHLGWWHFSTETGSAWGIPLELLVGWALLWGPLPILLARNRSIVGIIAVLLMLDLVLMPCLVPVLQLGERWLIGEALGLMIAFFPGHLLARWTLAQRFLWGRAMLQAVGFAGVMLVFSPAVLMTVLGDDSLLDVTTLAPWQLALLFLAVTVPTFIGLNAAQEFTFVGRGTAFPLDPPRRLVQCGLYRYVANPMQLSYLLMVPAMAAICTNYWILSWSIVTIIFGKCASVFEEEESLRNRFGPSWTAYHEEVRAWIPHFKPFIGACATLYISNATFPGRRLISFFETLHVNGLTIVSISAEPGRDASSMRYQCGHIEDQGVAAFGRALEHANLLWAVIGCLIRLGRVNQYAGPRQMKFHRCPSGRTEKPPSRTTQQRHCDGPGRWQVHFGRKSKVPANIMCFSTIWAFVNRRWHDRRGNWKRSG